MLLIPYQSSQLDGKGEHPICSLFGAHWKMCTIPQSRHKSHFKLVVSHHLTTIALFCDASANEFRRFWCRCFFFFAKICFCLVRICFEIRTLEIALKAMSPICNRFAVYYMWPETRYTDTSGCVRVRVSETGEPNICDISCASVRYVLPSWLMSRLVYMWFVGTAYITFHPQWFHLFWFEATFSDKFIESLLYAFLYFVKHCGK